VSAETIVGIYDACIKRADIESQAYFAKAAMRAEEGRADLAEIMVRRAIHARALAKKWASAAALLRATFDIW